MSENKKPRIAEILGVEVGERFSLMGFQPHYVEFWIKSDGTFETKPPRVPNSTVALLRAIEQPCFVIRKPRWTEQEAELAKALYEMRRSVSLVIGRSTGGTLWWRDGDRGEGVLPHKLFPSLNEGDCVRLIEIIGGAE